MAIVLTPRNTTHHLKCQGENLKNNHERRYVNKQEDTDQGLKKANINCETAMEQKKGTTNRLQCRKRK